jgi:hypothetical protein
MQFGKKFSERHQDAETFPENSTLQIRHSSESWNPVSLTLCKSLDSSFRWNDELSSISASRLEFSRTAMGEGRNDERWALHNR